MDNAVQNGVDTIRTLDRTGVETQVVLLDLGGTSAEALAGDSGVALAVKGLAAHDAAVTGNPVRIAGYAKAAAPSDVSADADTVNLWALLSGALCVNLTAAGALIGGDATNGIDVDVTRVGGNVTVINAGTFAVQAAQAGTWNVGTVSTVTAVTNLATIGTSVTPGTSAAHLGKAEDAAHSSGDTGVFALSVRSDTAASTAGTDGDYAALVTDSTGRLHVNVGNTVTVASHAVTNAGTFAVQATQAGTWTVQPGNTANTTAWLVTGTGGTFPATQSGTWNITNVSGTVSLPTGAATAAKQPALGTAGTASADVLTVQGIASMTPLLATLSGTNNIATVTAVTTVSTLTTCSTVTTLTGSGVAHDAADSGNPHKIGVKAKSSLAGITAVSADDRTDAYGDIDGVVLAREDCPLGDNVSGRATNTDGTATECIAAQAAGVKTYLTDITLSNSSSSNITVDIKDGSTIKWTFPVPASGGVVFSWKKPLAGTAATAWNFDPSAAATTVTCSMSGFRSKV